MKNIKKFFTILLCLTFILTAASCGKKKDNSNTDASISNIPTASADDNQSQENSEQNNADTDNSTSDESEAGAKSSSSGKQNNTQNRQESANKDRTPQTDNAEIESNIRDAQELINDGNIDDAKALIRVLRSRNLTESQEKRVDKLESQLISISD